MCRPYCSTPSFYLIYIFFLISLSLFLYCFLRPICAWGDHKHSSFLHHPIIKHLQMTHPPLSPPCPPCLSVRFHLYGTSSSLNDSSAFISKLSPWGNEGIEDIWGEASRGTVHHLFHLQGIWRAAPYYNDLQPCRSGGERLESSDMVWFELVTRGLLQNEVSAILTIHKVKKNAERGNREWKTFFLQVSCCFLFISSSFST